MNHLMTLYQFNLALVDALMADIDEDEMCHQPTEGVNPPAWLLGHLAICTDFTLEMLDQPKRLPDEWHSEFGPGSKPLSEEHAYPTKAELLLALREGHRAVIEALPNLNPEELDEPNPLPMEFLQKTLPTRGDLLGHLLTTHASFHVGHLSNWRRQMGRPPLF